MSLIRQWHGTGAPVGTFTPGTIGSLVGAGDNPFTNYGGAPQVVASGDQPNRLMISGPAAVTAAQILRMTLGVTLTQMTYSFMWTLATLPAGGVSPVLSSWYTTGLSLQGELDFQLSQRRLRLRNNTAVVTSGVALSLNVAVQYRVQVQINSNTVTVKIYDNRTNTVVDTFSGAVTSTVNELSLGTRFATADMRDTFYDDLMVDNTPTDIPAWLPATPRIFPAPAEITGVGRTYGRFAEFV